MDLVPALERTFDQMHRVARGVTADDYARPTPCAEWDVAMLMTHAFGVVDGIGTVASGSTPVPFELDRVAPAVQFRRLADKALAAWKTDGVLDAEMNAGAGPMPGRVYASINLLDTLVHSWDLATATSQDATIDDELATFTLGVSQQVISPDVRVGRFDAEVPTSSEASATDRLVGFLGRKA
jgi:uncharacterized protein (TIGR03086 family)